MEECEKQQKLVQLCVDSKNKEILMNPEKKKLIDDFYRQKKMEMIKRNFPGLEMYE